MKRASLVFSIAIILAAGSLRFADASAVRNCRVTAVITKCTGLSGNKYEITFRVTKSGFDRGHGMDSECLIKKGGVYTATIEDVKGGKALRPGKKITLSHITVSGHGRDKYGKSSYWRYPAE